MATRPQFKVQPSLPLPWYRKATEMCVYMCMLNPPTPFVSKRVILLFTCAHTVPLSLPLLCLICLLILQASTAVWPAVFWPSILSIRVHCSLLSAPEVYFMQPSKVCLATLWVTRGFHSDNFIWFSKEHCTLIIIFIEHEAFYFFLRILASFILQMKLRHTVSNGAEICRDLIRVIYDLYWTELETG